MKPRAMLHQLVPSVAVRSNPLPRQSHHESPEQELESNGQCQPNEADQQQFSDSLCTNPANRWVGNHENDRRTSEHAKLIRAELTDHRHQRNRPQNAVDDLGDNQDEPEIHAKCSGNLNMKSNAALESKSVSNRKE